MSELPAELRAALTKLAGGPTAAVRIDRVSGVLCLPPDEAAGVLASLVALGWMAVWENGPGGRPCAVLTARSAAALDLVIPGESPKDYARRHTV